MATGNNSASTSASGSLMDMPILVSDDSKENTEGKSTTSAITMKRKVDAIPSSSSIETHVQDLLGENKTNARNKNLSESEIALRNLESKLKEVQTKLNLNTGESSTTETVSMELKEKDAKMESEASIEGASNAEKRTNEPTTPKGLKLNVEAARKNQLKDSSGNVTTPQKQVAEAWKSVGLQRCRFCKFSTDSDSLFKQHMSTCTPKVFLLYSNGIYTCETCDLTWTVKEEFDEHIVCHTTDQPYVCVSCRKVFESRLLTEQHEKTEHPNGNAQYGIRGMKKVRKLVEELERLGRYNFKGKIDIPPTLRNNEGAGTKNIETSIKKTDEIITTGVGASQPVASVIKTTAAPSQINALSVSNSTFNTVLSTGISNAALIEEKMEKVRQYVISSRGGGVVESKEHFSGSQASTTNETKIVKEEPKESSHKAQVLTQTVNETPKAQVILQTPNAPVKNSGLTVHYQPNPKPINITVTQPQEALPNRIVLSPVSQPLGNQTYNPSSNILNIPGPPNISIPATPNANLSSSHKLPYNPRQGQTVAQQQPKQYQFQEYVYPPPPRPRIPVASVAPSPAVQTSVRATTTPKINPTPAPPAAVQTNSYVLLPVDFKAPNAPSNFLIPVTPINQSAQQGVQNTLSYPVVSVAQASNHVVRYPLQIASLQNNSAVSHSASMPASQQVLLTSSVSPSNTLVTVNSTPASKLQMKFTTNAIGPLSTESKLNQNSNGAALQGATAALHNVAAHIAATVLTTATTARPQVGSSANVAHVNSDRVHKTDTAIITTNTKHQVGGTPTVEIAVLPEKLQEKGSQGVKTSDSTSQHGPQYNLSKRYLFRIKPGHGFVCEACRKFTQDEVIFRRHVWDHFHTVTRSCKFCTPDHVRKKDFLNCNLVNNVVCSLVKKSASQSQTLAKDSTSQKSISVVDDEVIAISDDEEESKKTDTNAGVEQEIIVVDEEESSQKQNTENTVSSTGSLQEANKLETQKTDLRKEIVEDLKRGKAKDELHKDKLNIADSKQEEVKINKHDLKKDSKLEETKINKHDLKEGKSKLAKECAEDMGKTKCEDRKSENEINAKEVTSKIIETMQMGTDKELEGKPGNSSGKKDNIENDEQEQTELEQIESEKAKAAKLLYAAKVASRKFEKGVLSSRKSSAFYMCGFDQCSFTSLTSQKYKGHLGTNHSGAYSYICCHCGLKSFTEDQHMRHINSHANSKTFLLFNCPFNLCRYKTNLIHMFRDHVKSHKESGIECTYCHKPFETVEGLVDHLKANLVKYVSCPHCHFKFQLKETVAKHIKLVHPDKQRIVTVSSQIVCLERELNFYNAPLARTMPNEKRNSLDGLGLPLTQHEVDASNFLNTGETSDEKGTENNHTIPIDDDNDLSDRHSASPPPPVLTPVTPEKAKDGHSDKTHAEAPRSLVCSKCNFISWNYKLHLQHLSLHETDEPERERRFVCVYCPKGFDGLNPFKTHISNHVGKHELKIYGCTLCVFTTSQKCHIIDHCKDNHSGTGSYFEKTEVVVSKEASCKYCEFKSRRAEDVLLHEKVIHVKKGKKDVGKTGVAEVSKQQSTDDTEKSKHESPAGSEKSKHESPSKSESSEQSQKLRKYHCHYCMNYFKHKADLKEHMQTSHTDIESKSFVTFKCKYCHFTSTMKNLIINHIERKHINEPVRILRRIENIDETEIAPKRTEEKTIYRCGICELSMDSNEKLKKHFAEKHANDDSDERDIESGSKEGKETMYIPDGNTFKDPVQCPKCPYSNKLRVNILRHIKEHPELVPSRDPIKGDQSPAKMTARKSTSKSSVTYEEKKLKNPFAAVKEAVKELDRTDKDHSKTVEQLALGGEFLHQKLADCYIPLDKEFKCKICQQKIIKKFVLHRHILNHLRVVFFKCHYCNKGDIEQSLLSGHIQQQHSLQPIKFNYMDISEVCSEIQEKVKKHNFIDDSPRDVQEIADNSGNSDEVSLGFGIIRKQIHEADINGDDEPEESVFKCSRCDYFTKREDNLLRHRKSHMNLDGKKYGCSICAYRSMKKSQVMHHMKTIHPNQPLKYKVFGNNSEKTVTESEEKKETDKQSEENANDKNNKEDSSKVNSKAASEVSGKPSNITVSDAGTFEIKSIFKCKECGEKRNSKWAMYQHFKTSKCYKQWYQCDACAFSNQYKKAITQHAKIRHPGRKVGIVELPLSHKIRLIKVPVKQDEKSVQANGRTSPKGDGTESQEQSASKDKTDVYECQVCNNYKSESLSKLQYHMNTKHQGKPLFCVECDYKTALVKHMINHCADVHKMDKAKYSIKSKDAKESNKTLNQDKTETSNKSKDTHATTLKKYKCLSCDIARNSPKELRDHMQIHFDYKPYMCKYCSFHFRYFGNVTRHINTLHKGKTVKYSMVKDEKIEKKLDEMLDKICKQREKENSKMIKNTVQMIKSKPGKRSIESDEEVLPPKKKKRAIIETDDSTSQDDSAGEEESAVKYRVVREPGTNAKLFQCMKCNFKTPKKERLHGHLDKHVRGNEPYWYKCAYCDYTRAHGTSAIYRHIRTNHRGKPQRALNMNGQDITKGKRRRVMETESSSESSSDDESLASEQSSKKMVTLKYFCNICDFRVTGLYLFRQHLAIHSEYTRLQKGSDISRLSCGYCSYMAIDDADFSVHIATHLDERPYKCGYCEFSGFTRSGIKSHQIFHHPDKEELISDNTPATGEMVKVKQTMLVNFDPQIKLQKIEMSSLMKNQIRPGTWKLEREEMVKVGNMDTMSGQTMTKKNKGKTDSPKVQMKIDKLFSLQSKAQKKLLSFSDSKDTASSLSKANIEKDYSSNANEIPDKERGDTTEVQRDIESETEIIIDDSLEDRSDIINPSPEMKESVDEGHNTYNNSTERSSENMDTSPPLNAIAGEKDIQKNEKNETANEKRSPNFKSVSVKIPSPVKSGEFKTVRFKVPFSMTRDKSVDRSLDNQGTNNKEIEDTDMDKEMEDNDIDKETEDNDLDLPRFTGSNLVYGDETPRTEINMTVDNDTVGTDDTRKKEKQNSTETGKDINEIIGVSIDNNESGIISEESKNAYGVNEATKDNCKSGDTNMVENVIEQMETESFERSKTETEDLDLPTFGDQENEDTKITEKYYRDSNKEIEIDSNKTDRCTLQEKNGHTEKNRSPEFDIEVAPKNIVSQGFEVLDESESLTEPESVAHNDALENIQLISESQPVDYDRETDKDTPESHEEEKEQTVEEFDNEKDENHSRTDRTDSEKRNESDIENVREDFNNVDSKLGCVSHKLELNGINDIAPSRHDTVDGDHEKINLVTETIYENISSDSDSEQKDCTLDKNRSDVTDVERKEPSNNLVTDKNFSIDTDDGSHEKTGSVTETIYENVSSDSDSEQKDCTLDKNRSVATDVERTDPSNNLVTDKNSSIDTVDGGHEKTGLVTETIYENVSTDSDSEQKDNVLDQNRVGANEIDGTNPSNNPVIDKNPSIVRDNDNTEDESHDDILSKIDSVLLESQDHEKTQGELKMDEAALDLKDQHTETSVDKDENVKSCQ